MYSVLLAVNLSISPRVILPVAGLIALLVTLLVVGKIPLGYNVRNLKVRWRTTLLTALAFTLVISLQTVMLAFVAGMYELTEQSGHPGNVIVLSDGATDEVFSNLGYNDSSDIDRQPLVLRDDENRPLASRETYLIVNQPLPSAPGEKVKRRFTQVRGIDDPAISAHVHSMNLFEGGTWFSEAGVRSARTTDESGNQVEVQAIEAVLGEGVAQQLGRDRGRERLEVGDLFLLSDRQWIVMGVMQSSGSTFGSEVWAKRALVGPMFGKQAYTTVVVRSENRETAKALSLDLNENFTKASLMAQPETEYFAKLSETNRQFTFAIIFVTIVMAVGGVFGVMNTMFAAISQRTRDIGVLRIIGFARWQILVSFFVESLLIALVGGLLGCALGTLCDGWTATSIVGNGQGGGKSVVLRLIVSPETIAAGLLVTLLMGVVGGLVPALSAMRLRPLESLR